MAQGKELEAEALCLGNALCLDAALREGEMRSEAGTCARSHDWEAELLRDLNERLHELSQPMTVLLCALDYGGGVESMAEMKQMIEISQKACERLRDVSLSMRARVCEAMEERTAMEERHGDG